MPTKKKVEKEEAKTPNVATDKPDVQKPVTPPDVEEKPTPPPQDPPAGKPEPPKEPVIDKPMTVTADDETKGANVNETIGNRVAAQVAQPVLPKAHSLPTIYAGKCEYCGESYKTCKHYRGIDVFCSYCGRKDVFDFRVVQAKVLDDKPGEIIFICADYKCQKAHKDKFTPSPLVR